MIAQGQRQSFQMIRRGARPAFHDASQLEAEPFNQPGAIDNGGTMGLEGVENFSVVNANGNVTNPAGEFVTEEEDIATLENSE
jgi:hypothetical protein